MYDIYEWIVFFLVILKFILIVGLLVWVVYNDIWNK